MEYRPPGGFTNFLQDSNGAPIFPFPPPSYPPHPAHHMLRFPFPYPPQFMPPPAAPSSSRSSPLASDSRSSSPANIARQRVTIDVEVDEESRQRMYYTDEEDIRLVSAWLNNSTDPIEGNSKKAARYWEEVAAAYNETTPADRKRDVKLLKSHWYKTTKKISSFNGCYNQMRDTYASGRSDDQLMDQALELYRNRYKHHFTYVHWWRAVRDCPKWNAHIAAEGQGTKRSLPELDVNKAPPNIRPMGCKKAKKMKGISNGATSTVVEQQLEKLVNAQTEINAGISGMKDFQERLSAQKVEAAKLSYMAAKENKESKMMEHRSKMMDKFSEMLNVDTSKMEPWAKQAHLRAVTALSDELFGRDGEA